MKTNKALLLVEPADEAFSRFASILKKPSKSKYKGYTIISFPSFKILGQIMSGARLELLSVIKNEKPSSIQDLSRILGRDFKNVYTDVKLLSNFGLIELKETGARKAAKPQAIFTEFLIAA